jgi:hypothetical protein
MRRIVGTWLTLVFILCAGCERREPKVVGTLLAPDMKHVLWVMNEYGGLRSGIVSVYLTKPGGTPTPQNQILRTPECSGAAAAWANSSSVMVVYDSIAVSLFESDFPNLNIHVQLVKRTTDLASAISSSKRISLPCDPL